MGACQSHSQVAQHHEDTVAEEDATKLQIDVAYCGG
jgi:hypothetical protein